MRPWVNARRDQPTGTRSLLGGPAFANAIPPANPAITHDRRFDQRTLGAVQPLARAAFRLCRI
jgi:hypothetical protein